MQQNTGHTPGPWVALDTGEVFACENDSVFASDLQICSTVAQDGYEEEQANARLIAAAPELYEMLAELLRWPAIRAAIGSDFEERGKSLLAKATQDPSGILTEDSNETD